MTDNTNASETLNLISSILSGSFEGADPGRLAVAAFRLGATLSSGEPSMTRTQALRVGGCYLKNASDLDTILSSLKSSGDARVEEQKSGKQGRPQTLITLA